MKVHLIGLGGIGMSALAQLLLSRGERVSGSDLSENPLLDRIRALGGRVCQGHALKNLNRPDCVVYSSSISPDNPELVAARNRGIPVLHRGQMLAQLLEGKKAIAVTGAHGKSTTAAMVAHLLVQEGWDPTVLLGAEVDALGGNVRQGRGRWAVVEADESDGSLLWLSPSVVILTNGDEEHLDYFRNSGEILETYAGFLKQIPPDGLFIGCSDDPWVSQLLHVCNKRRLRYGLSPKAQFRADHVECGAGLSRYQVVHGKRPLGGLELKIPGIHNVVNSLAVVALAHAFGIPFKDLQQALKDYPGARRRFEVKGETDGILVVEDYGHHPAEIEATLAAAKKWQGRRLICVFQPHRFTRTRYLFDRFSRCFDQADWLILLPIYAASEDPLDGVSSESLLRAITQRGRVKATLETPPGALKQLTSQARSGDLVLFLGAGSVGSLAPRLVQALKTRARSNGS